MKEFSKLCTPAKVYFALAVIGCLIALFNRMSVLGVFVKLIFAFIWTFVLGYLCDMGYKSLSWFLVLIPYVIILFMMLGMMNYGMMGYNMMGYNGMMSPMYKMMSPMYKMMGYNGMGYNGMGYNGMGYNGMSYNGMGYSKMMNPMYNMMGYNNGYMYEGMENQKKKMGYDNMGRHMT